MHILGQWHDIAKEVPPEQAMPCILHILVIE